MSPNVYRSYDPNTEISGQRLKAILVGMESDILRPLLAKYGYTEIDPEGWYNLQQVLDFFTEVEATPNTLFDLVAIGIKVAEQGRYLPGLTTLPQVLQMISQLHLKEYRNGDAGDVTLEMVDERRARLRVKMPMPADLMYGLIYGVVRKFAPSDSRLNVKRTILSQDEGVYEIAW